MPDHDALSAQLVEVKDLLVEVAHKVERQGEQIADTFEIVQAWGAVKTGGRFVITLGKIATGLAAVYLFFKHVLGAVVLGMVR